MATSAKNLKVSSDFYEDMDILLIGAAPAPDPTQGDEKEFPMFNSVKHDLQTMYDRCLKDDVFKPEKQDKSLPRSYLNIKRCLVNHDQLAPTPPMYSSQKLKGTEYNATPYNSVKEIRDYVTDFLTDEVGPNLLIYVSGHGSYDDGTDGAASAGAKEESLTIPVLKYNRHTKRQETTMVRYTASQLTADINAAMKSREGGDDETSNAKVYVVIDACHAEGLVNMWSLDGNVRLNDFVVLFAGAETALDADYDNGGGKFTNAFAKHFLKGKKLYILAQEILEDLYDPKKRSPAVRYSHPSLCEELLLKPTNTGAK